MTILTLKYKGLSFKMNLRYLSLHLVSHIVIQVFRVFHVFFDGKYLPYIISVRQAAGYKFEQLLSKLALVCRLCPFPFAFWRETGVVLKLWYMRHIFRSVFIFLTT